jgi:hypothetical protein
MSTIHAGKSRTIPMGTTNPDSTPLVGVTAVSSQPTFLQATVNPDNSITRKALSPNASVSTTVSAPGYLPIIISDVIPQLPPLVLGADGPEV